MTPLLAELQRTRARFWENVPTPAAEANLDCTHLFSGLTPLKLDPNYTLRLFVNGGNSGPRLFAVPKTQSASSLALAEGALEHFMLAVEGDGSPFCYLLASVLGRDAEELAVSWDGLVWRTPRWLTESPFWSAAKLQRVAIDLVRTAQDSPIDCVELLLSQLPGGAKLQRRKERHGVTFPLGVEELLGRLDCRDLRTVQRLISEYYGRLTQDRVARFYEEFGRLPANLLEFYPDREGDFGDIDNVPCLPEEEWEWSAGRPSNWTPTVVETEQHVEVTFLTFSGIHVETIIRHRDTFKRGCYWPVRERTVVGRGGIGST